MTLEDLLEQAVEESPELQPVVDKIDEIVQGMLSGDLKKEDFLPALKGLVMDESLDSLLFQGADSVEKLNPLLAGQIAERMTFDGDVPEFRTGCLPADGTPAVPVDTSTLNPVALGAMLKQASEEVKQEIKALSAESSREMLPDTLRDPVGYARGSLPQLRKVEGTSTLALSKDERKDLTWRAVSTTQGRRSSVQGIKGELTSHLESLGCAVTISNGTKESPEFSHEWSVSVEDKGNVRDGFSHASVALSAFKARLTKYLERVPYRDFSLRVSTVDDIPERTVGWRVDLYRERD